MQYRRAGTPTLVALHGHDDDEAATRQWALRVAPPGWQVLAPGCPGDDAGVRSWFDSGPRGVDPASWSRSRDHLARVVAEAAAGGPVVLAGFSQGAAMALSAGGLPGVRAVVGLCPFLPELDAAGSDAVGSAREGSVAAPDAGPPALLLCGARDEVVPAFLGEDAAAVLGSAGREVTVETLPGGHQVGADTAARARSWIEDRVPSRMRVSLGLPVDRVETGTELVSGEAVAELAAGWEALGIDAAYVTDHPAPDDRWLAAGGHHALEPTVALSVAATATTSLLLHTHVYVLGYRNPFLAAKALASLDVLSGGRLVLGVAAGYLRAEFEAAGVPFDSRAERLDVALGLLSRIWSGETVSGEGEGWSARSVTALPRPAQRPGPPIWVGGNSLRAMRRAVAHGQGWSPFPTPGGLERATRTAAITDSAHLADRLARLDELCEQEGRRDRPTVCFSPFSLGDYLADPDGGLGALVDEAAGLWELGVDWLALSVPGLGRAEILERTEALAVALAEQAG